MLKQLEVLWGEKIASIYEWTNPFWTAVAVIAIGSYLPWHEHALVSLSLIGFLLFDKFFSFVHWSHFEANRKELEELKNSKAS